MQNVLNFIKTVEVQHNLNIKVIRSDNDHEFIMPNFYSSKGISHQTNWVESPQQNGRAEIKHEHILNIARALIFQSNTPNFLGSYVVNHVVYIMNKVTSPILNNKSPYYLLFNEEHDLHVSNFFGTLAYASTIQCHITKLDYRDKKRVFMNFKQVVKSVILLGTNNNENFLSRNVIHHEHIFSYKPNGNYHTTSNFRVSPFPKTFLPEPSQPIQHVSSQPEQSTISQSEPSYTLSTQPSSHFENLDTNHQNIDQDTNLQRPVKNIHLLTHLKEYVCNSSNSFGQSSFSCIIYPISSFLSFNFPLPSHRVFSTLVTNDSESKSY